jgi:hypothetical protein
MVRVTAEEKAEIKAEADKRGLGMSAFLRYAARFGKGYPTNPLTAEEEYALDELGGRL